MQCIQIEHQWFIDLPIDGQFPGIRIDVWHAVMVSFEMQAIGRYYSFKIVQWCPGHAGSRHRPVSRDPAYRTATGVSGLPVVTETIARDLPACRRFAPGKSGAWNGSRCQHTGYAAGTFLNKPAPGETRVTFFHILQGYPLFVTRKHRRPVNLFC